MIETFRSGENMKTHNRALSLIIIVIACLISGCLKEKDVTNEPPPHQAIAALPRESVAIQVTPAPPSPTTAVAVSSPSPSPTQDFGAIVSTTVKEQAIKTNAKSVDLVFCLDVSGSMEPLLAAAKDKLLEIANSIRSLSQKPELRVAIISFGNNGYNSGDGWVHLDSDFTNDMRAVEATLSGLRAGGDREYVSRAINMALSKLNWSTKPGTLFTLFVAGNESVRQDPELTLEAAIQQAKKANVVINTIYCSNPMDMSNSEWEELARAGGGKYAEIAFTGSFPGIGPLPSGFPSNFPFSLPSNFPVQLQVSTPKPQATKSAPVSSQTKDNKKEFQGQVIGIISGSQLLMKEQGGSTRSFNLDNKTRYTPSSWHPASGENVVIYVNPSQPDRASEIKSLE